MSLETMREELRLKYERLRKEEERKLMLKYYEPIKPEAAPLFPPLKRKEPLPSQPLLSKGSNEEKFLVKCKHCGDVIELKYAPSHIRDIHGISLKGRKTEDDFIILGRKGSSSPDSYASLVSTRRTNPEIEIEDRSKAEYWIELEKEVMFAPGLSRTERARMSLNLIYQSTEHLSSSEFAKFARRWRELTAPLEESSSHSAFDPKSEEVEWWKLGADDLEKRREADTETKKVLFEITLRYLKEDLKSYRIIDSRTSTDPFARDCRICVSPHMAWAVPGAEETASGREKVIYLNPDWLNSLDEKFRALLIAHEKCHIEKKNCVADQACATLCALENLNLSEKEKTDLARRWYSFWAKEGLHGDEKYITQLRKLLRE